MRPLEYLLNSADPAWPQVQEWLRASPRSVEVVPGNRASGETALLRLQISVASTLGAVLLQTGGILLDHGWLRLLGAGGSDRMRRDIFAWNSLGTENPEAIEGALVVAHDVIGGFFAINGGAFPGTPGSMHYLAPDTLRWEDLSIGHTQFFQWATTGDMPMFYEDMRWDGWESDASALAGDQGFSIYPPLWMNADLPIAERSRRIVPILELWGLELDLGRQISALPDGTAITIKVVDE